MATTTSLELTSNRPEGNEEEHSEMASIDTLPPTDRGRGAYTALACCTMAQAPIWGKYSQHLIHTVVI
jgi:hypothetical protein